MSENNRDPARPQTQIDEGRVRFLVMDGLHWKVREVPVPQYDRRGGTHLLFESDSIMRRVRAFPPNWFEISDAELYALTDHALRQR